MNTLMPAPKWLVCGELPKLAAILKTVSQISKPMK